MKKAPLLLLTAAMILSLFAGCGDTNSVSWASQDSSAAQTQGADTLPASQLPEGALVIQEQGNFSAGGTVVTSEGEFNPMEPWTTAQGGQTRHGDHADVLYQIPVGANDTPMVFLHGYGQSRRSWQTTADRREGFSNIFYAEAIACIW